MTQMKTVKVPSIAFQSVIEEDVIHIPAEYGDLAGALVQVVILLESQPKHTSSTKKRLQSLYGAFEDAPIPDKEELRRRFHEKSAH